MSHIIICDILADAMAALRALRLAHLEYIAAHRDTILFGGPARDDGGRPERMIIVVTSEDAETAAAFIAREPYNASGRVFSAVTIRRWTQVLPEPFPGALAAAIADERRRPAVPPP